MVRILASLVLGAVLLLVAGCGASPDQAPEARSVRVVMPANGTAQGRAQGWDPDGDAVTFELLSAPVAGTLVFDTSDGRFSYVPFTGFAGTDQFSFRVHSVSGSSGPASVAFDVALPVGAG